MKKENKKKEKARIVRIKEIAAVLNLTPSRIQQLVQEGLPKKLRGSHGGTGGASGSPGWRMRCRRPPDVISDLGLKFF